MDITTQQIGKAGELRILSELTLRGLHTAVATCDNGTDIFLLHNNKKIQVKTSLKPSYSKNDYSWRYSFAIRAFKFRKADKGFYRKVTRRKYEVDYFIFWCIQHNLFYIIPAKEMNERVSIVIPTEIEERKYKKQTWKKSTSKYTKFKNNWDLLK